MFFLFFRCRLGGDPVETGDLRVNRQVNGFFFFSPRSRFLQYLVNSTATHAGSDKRCLYFLSDPPHMHWHIHLFQRSVSTLRPLVEVQEVLLSLLVSFFPLYVFGTTSRSYNGRGSTSYLNVSLSLFLWSVSAMIWSVSNPTSIIEAWAIILNLLLSTLCPWSVSDTICFWHDSLLLKREMLYMKIALLLLPWCILLLHRRLLKHEEVLLHFVSSPFVVMICLWQIRFGRDLFLAWSVSDVILVRPDRPLLKHEMF